MAAGKTKDTQLTKVKRKTQQAATIRIFTLLEKLRRGRYTLEQLMQLVGKSKSVIYEYINFLRQRGYNIENVEGKYSLLNTEGVGLESLGAEERELLKTALVNFAPNNVLAGSILEKLFSSEDLASLADNLITQHDFENLRCLLDARDRNKRVMLKYYQSTRGSRLSDRIFEPKIFYADQQKIHGCEINAARTVSATKTFNLERIGSVVPLDESQTFTMTEEIVDMFGWSGTEPRVFELRLSKRAKLILEKDFPNTRKYICDDGGGKFHIRGTYTGVEFITRFVLSLPNEIEVLNDSFLRAHLNEQIDLFKKF